MIPQFMSKVNDSYGACVMYKLLNETAFMRAIVYFSVI